MNCHLKVYVITAFIRGVNDIFVFLGCYITFQESEDLNLCL